MEGNLKGCGESNRGSYQSEEVLWRLCFCRDSRPCWTRQLHRWPSRSKGECPLHCPGTTRRRCAIGAVRVRVAKLVQLLRRRCGQPRHGSTARRATTRCHLQIKLLLLFVISYMKIIQSNVVCSGWEIKLDFGAHPFLFFSFHCLSFCALDPKNQKEEEGNTLDKK